MSQPKYRFYASLFNRFDDLLHYEAGCEAPWNKTPEGDYKLSPEEFADNIEKELIDSINRVPHEPSEAADRGTVFNEIVDRMVLNCKDGREDVKIWSSKTFTADNGQEYDMPCVYGEMEGFRFCFDLELCKQVRDIFRGAVPQYRCSAIMDTNYGPVELYGDCDYILRNRIYDLKTTSSYDFGKFSNNWQKVLYPYCLNKSGDVKGIDEFTFFVCKWKKSTMRPWGADLYGETYSIKFDTLEENLRLMTEHFIEWLEAHRSLITNKKIFALD